MLKRMLISAAALLTIMTGTLVSATPAQAAAADCPSGLFCLFHHINWGAGRWQINPATTSKNVCWNYANSTFTDGYVVDNASASYIDKSPSKSYGIILYDRNDCTGTGSYSIPLGFGTNVPNLSTEGYYRAFGSYKLVQY